MEEWIRQTLSHLGTGAGYYLLIFIITLAEGIPAIGLFVPGSVVCVAAGALAFHDHGDIFFLSCSAATGAIAGDFISYVSGARSGRYLTIRLRRKKLTRFLQRAELFFGAHGGKSLFLARFMGPVRGFVPFVAGGVRMNPSQFSLCTVVGGISWGIAYPLMGYLGGKAFHFSKATPVNVITLCIGLGLLFLIILKASRHRRQRKNDPEM